MTETKKYQILWVHDYFNGPVNGLLLAKKEIGDEKLWFDRCDDSSEYKLIKLSSEDIASIEEKHILYCKERGLPVYHGDPFIRSKQPRTFKIYGNVLKSSDIKGEEVGRIVEKDFENFHVPNIIIDN